MKNPTADNACRNLSFLLNRKVYLPIVMLSERMQQQSRKDNYQASIAIALSISGGEIGGTAASWYTDDEVSKAFLEVA